MIFLILMPNYSYYPKFHSPLNIENDSAGGASVYWGHILVVNCYVFKALYWIYLLQACSMQNIGKPRMYKY